MKNKPFAIYAMLSLLIAMFVLMYQPIEKKVFQIIENRMMQTNQKIQKENEQKIEIIKREVEIYPYYFKYQKAAQQLDTFTQQQLADVTHSDLIYFSDSLYSFFENEPNIFPKEEFTTEIDKIINTSNDDFYNTLKTNQIIFKQNWLLNYFVKKSQQTRISCSFGPEFVFLIRKDVFFENEPTTVSFGLADFPKKGSPINYRIWVNETALATRDGKSRFKHKITRSGWHDMKVKITAEYLGKPIEKEMVYQYYVCP